jgi:hypothetical protein
MLILGVILLILGYLLGIPPLTTIGLVLLIAGAILAVLGGLGHPLGGRRHYW